MMKIRLLLFFIFSSVFAFSQMKITGKVLDKETQKTVPDVIVHSSNGISITNDRGEYDFEINQSEAVYFRHLSYNPLKMQSDSLQNNGAVYLIPNVTELDEIVVSPERAKYLLNKAIHNLFANFQKEKTNTYYLTHVEENTTKGGEREAYALIETLLDKARNDDRKQFFDWDLKLTQLDKIKYTGIDDFIAGKKNYAIQFFPSPFEFSSDKIEEIYEENDDYVIIKRYPQYLNKRNYHYFLYTINKQDTVITEMVSQSYSNSNKLTAQKANYIVHNHFSIKTFSKNVSGLYYLEQYQHFAHIKIMTDTPYEATFTVLTYALENISIDEVATGKKKRIYFPYSNYLYKSKLPDSPGFWKKYVKD